MSTPNATDVARWTIEQLLQSAEAPVAVLASPSVAARIGALLPWPQVARFEDVPAATATLVAVGGGTLLDAVKIARADTRPDLKLVAIASLWGSGSEASPVAVAWDGERKIGRLEPALAPDARVEVAELAQSLPDNLALDGCGDAWSHTLEAFLSPLATEDVRAACAALMRDMLAVGVGTDPRWFELSARACALQASAGVGLIHGIAHTLEGPLRAEFPARKWGHALLCRIYLQPVLALNRSLNDKWTSFAQTHGVPAADVERTMAALHDPEAYAETLDLLAANWKRVLRDPLTRTNSALVRRGHLDHFVQRAFA